MSNSGQFKPGQSGNPSGRPKTPPEIKAMFEAKGPEAYDLLAKHLKHKDPRIAQSAAALILDRAYGKPTQSLEVEQNTTNSWIGDPPMTPEKWEATYGLANTDPKH